MAIPQRPGGGDQRSQGDLISLDWGDETQQYHILASPVTISALDLVIFSLQNLGGTLLTRTLLVSIIFL